MFNKLFSFIKGLVGKKEEKQNPEQERMSINADRFRRIQEQGIQEQPAEPQAEPKKLIHPRTKEEIQPLKNVYKDPKTFIKAMSDATFGEEQWPYLEKLLMNESSWNPEADNGTNAGLFQLSKDYYPLKDMSLQEQWRVGSNYIKNRYKNPQGALNFWENVAPTYQAKNPTYSKNWY